MSRGQHFKPVKSGGEHFNSATVINDSTPYVFKSDVHYEQVNVLMSGPRSMNLSITKLSRGQTSSESVFFVKMRKRLLILPNVSCSN